MFVSSFNVVQAQTLTNISECDTVNWGSPTLAAIACPLASAFNALIGLAAAVFVVFILIASYRYSNSIGDPKAAAGAKKTLTFSIIGFLIIIGIFTIMKILASALGLGTEVEGYNPFNNLIQAINTFMCHVSDAGGGGTIIECN